MTMSIGCVHMLESDVLISAGGQGAIKLKDNLQIEKCSNVFPEICHIDLLANSPSI